MSSHQSSKEIRAGLGHPVIDSDGHYVEFGPSIIDYIKKVAGPRVADAFVAPHCRIAAAIGIMPAERRDRGLAAEGFWVGSSLMTHLATAGWQRLSLWKSRVCQTESRDTGIQA